MASSTPILSRVAANHPVIAAMATAAVQAVVANSATPIPRDVQQQMHADISATIAADPVTANNIGAEPLSQSRTFMGGASATLAAFGTAATALAGMLGAFNGVASPGQPGFWLALILFLTGGASGSGGALTVVGRLRDDLPPMNRHWWNPFSWLSKRSAQTAPVTR